MLPLPPTLSPKLSSTTSFLTATTLVYAIGAGITAVFRFAAAGTRLALQWVLVNRFKLYSFQLPVQRTRISMYCHYLPMSGLGNLRACCLPWKWWPSLRPPLRNRTLIPRYPLSPRLSNTQPSKVDRAETWMIHQSLSRNRSDKIYHDSPTSNVSFCI